MKHVLQQILKHTERWEEHTSRGNSGGFSWWKTRVTTLHLACGHKSVVRGDFSIPEKRAKCPTCGNGAQL